MDTRQNSWARIALLNLCIVATVGVIMRYKILYEFPFLDQKYLQEAHSHFAFTGWITHVLFCLITILFRKNLGLIKERRYHLLILLNLLSAYGMLFAFAAQGYGPVSITSSSISQLTGYVFYYFAFRDANRLPAGHPAKNWIKGAILFGFLSTLGTLVLSRMMITRAYDQEVYLGSIFLYLHFQYNGWFLFSCAAIFMDKIKTSIIQDRKAKWMFWSFFLAAIPSYLLSLLWIPLPTWVYGTAILSTILQMMGWLFFIQLVRLHWGAIKPLFSRNIWQLFLTVGLAMTVKLFLQLISTIPAIHHLAFEFRPIVIAYLHLILLLIISVFLLSFLHGSGILKQTKTSMFFLTVFVGGIIANEIVLATQGILAISYTILPFVKEMLFGVSFLMWLCLCFLLGSHLRSATS